MKPWRSFALALATVALMIPASLPAAEPVPGPRAALWRAVDEAAGQGQPKTALERLKPIEAAALRDRAWPELVRAIGRRVAFETEIQGNLPEERLRRFEAALKDAPPPIQPILRTLVANAYWAYFQQNRWRIQQRTAVAQPAAAADPAAPAGTDDLQTWDLRRLFAEIDRQFGLALADAETLQRTPIASLDGLLEPGTVPDRYRPTVYDFLVHQALEFYTAGEQAGARPEDAFTLPADSPIFDDAEAFVAWKPDTTDTNSPALKALQWHQALLRFHRGDAEPSALADADLGRLIHGRNAAVGPTRDERFVAALRRFAERWSRHELSARARAEWASVLHRQNRSKEAHEVASVGVREHPGTPGATECRNLIRTLENREVSIATERVWNAPLPAIEVNYRNVRQVWFRAIAVDWEQFLDRRRPRPENLDARQRREFMERAPAAAWTSELPPTDDFRSHRFEISPPAGLPAGFYFLFASHRADFSEEDNTLSVAEIWVSDLALIVRPRAGHLEGFVLDARTGEPIAGATVDAWQLDNAGQRVSMGSPTTDALGTFSFPDRRVERPYLIRARHGNRQVAMAQDLWWMRVAPPRQRSQQTILFTDRALYRPGQLVHYKGICLRLDDASANYSLLAGHRAVVVFRDTNGKEIARQERTANDYGSFSGSFTTPRDRLTGAMTLLVEGESRGHAVVQVEEYKRPKFQVTLEAPRTAPRLGDTAVVTAKALAYTGAAIDGAQVSWRVTRQVRFPPWFGWFGRGSFWPGRQDSQEIAHGTTRTDAAGTFELAFRALPDPAVPESDEPTFEFEVHADVTDSAGETRSDERTVRVGYTALQAVATASEWQTGDRPTELRVETRTLDGEGQAAEGILRIHRLREPDRVARPRLTPFRPGRWQLAGDGDDATAGPPDLSDPNRWELGVVAAEQPFRTDAGGVTTNQFTLEPGLYRAVLETRDRFGKPVGARLPLRVLDPASDRLAPKIPHLLTAPAWTVQPGADFTALWGTGYDAGRAFVEIEERDRIVERYWTADGRTQQTIRRAVTEALRGGFTVHVTQVHDNRAYLESRFVDVPWSNKELEIAWETFRSKLEPGARETWTAVIRRRPGTADETRPFEAAAAELVATLYDASLDQFHPHAWQQRFGIFPTRRSQVQHHFANTAEPFQAFVTNFRLDFENVDLRYRMFPPELRFAGADVVTVMSPMMITGTALADGAPRVGRRNALALSPAAPAPAMMMAKGAMAPLAEMADTDGAAGGAEAPTPPRPDPATVTARKNLQETAFFLPHATSDSNGVVRLSFTLPEALTQWRFLGFAHDRDLRSGFLEAKAVTAKDLMVQPNPPRFLREGDQLEFTVKISNQSETRQTGRALLNLAFALDGATADSALGNTRPEQPFDIPAKESRTLSWRLRVPDACGFLTFKAVATTGPLSDGEEGFLPVLPGRIFLTESLPLPIRGPAEKRFSFAALAESARSRSLRHESVTVQMVSNPAWYAVLALPYLMEYPHECAEQTFNRLYANALARHIAVRDPKVKAVFDQWRATPALDSPLHRNQDLKSVLIEETPWLRQANRESEARRNVAVLFEDNRLQGEIARALQRLTELQLPDGGWSWFPGGRRNDFITLYLVTGFGRLRHLGVDVPMGPAERALPPLDAWMTERHRRLREDGHLAGNHLDPTIALYLYGRSFFLREKPVAEPNRPALDYWLAQAREHWLQTDRQSQGHLALALARWGDANTARAILRSLKERSVSDDEMGMFWRDTERSWWWYRAPIETQALMIEAFDEVAGDAPAVEDLKVWLLKQKQTRDWKTTKATADAVYALLRRGTDLLAGNRLVEVELGGRNLTPGSASAPARNDSRSESPSRAATPAVEPGTGFYEVRLAGAEVTPALADIRVKKADPGVAWGSVHWQYFEALDAVKPYEGTPLTLRKSVFTRTRTKAGAALEPVRGALKVGDELVVRIELRVDRDLEYVHLKDHRGSGTEPVNVLSGYRFQDGLGYYESTRDTASHFFVDYLPKGTYVFEYPVRVQHRGEYPTGIASIQCMYAPEFNSHSGSIPLKVE
jgi:uncharacterized protein YfaS (alpha-2-macroglobulin family)